MLLRQLLPLKVYTGSYQALAYQHELMLRHGLLRCAFTGFLPTLPAISSITDPGCVCCARLTLLVTHHSASHPSGARRQAPFGLGTHRITGIASSDFNTTHGHQPRGQTIGSSALRDPRFFAIYTCMVSPVLDVFNPTTSSLLNRRSRHPSFS